MVLSNGEMSVVMLITFGVCSSVWCMCWSCILCTIFTILEDGLFIVVIIIILGSFELALRSNCTVAIQMPRNRTVLVIERRKASIFSVYGHSENLVILELLTLY